MPDSGAAASGMVRYLPGFRFEPTIRRLSTAGDEVRLRPKTTAVLETLIAGAGELVTKQELLRAVWPEGFVGDAALTVCINELRRALGDSPRAPAYITTVPGRGYRLIAEVSTTPLASTDEALPFVGRVPALATLTSWWDQAQEGRRCVGFVTAQAGVGKTRVVDAFVDRLRGAAPVLIGRGQCVEQYGRGEPYLPALEALGTICRGPGGSSVIRVLRHCAPSWLAQLPGLPIEHEPAPVRTAVGPTSAERMLREFAVAVEVLSAQRQVLLVFEDLHDADRATVELLSYLAQRREAARLLILGTYRPAELIARDHPLHRVVRHLVPHGLARLLPLELLTVDEVADYLSALLGPEPPCTELISAVYERTEGNALFVKALCEHLHERNLLAEVGGEVRAVGRLASLGVPREVRAMVEQQVDTLADPDRQLLTVAAAVGVEFTSETVRAGLGGDLSQAQVEERCDRLARTGALVHGTGNVEWPDGTFMARYRFTHEMYREVLYDRLGPASRTRVHLALATRLAAGYRPRTAQVAADLALHFERGRDYPAAVAQIVDAATTALARSAYPEARRYAQHGLDLLPKISCSAERAHLELGLCRIEVVAAAATWGWRDPLAPERCRRLLHLAVESGDAPAQVAALLGLHNTAMMEGDGAAMSDCIRRIDLLAAGTGDTSARLTAQFLHIRADSRVARWAAMWDRARQMLDADRPGDDAGLALLLGDELDVAAHLYGGLALWHLGYPDQAQRHVEAAVDSARTAAIPAGLARTLWFAAVVYLLRGDAARVHELAIELDTLCVRHGLRLWRAGGAVLDAWARARRGELTTGLAGIRRAMASWAALTGIGTSLHLRLVAELCLADGDASAGLAAVSSGLDAVASEGGAQSESELWRLRGELLVLESREHTEAAERCLRRAVALAVQCGGRSDQLRATTSLARLLARTGHAGQARSMLADIYGSFTEGHHTSDLAEARQLLSLLMNS